MGWGEVRTTLGNHLHLAEAWDAVDHFGNLGEGVALGVEDGSCCGSDADGGNASDDDDSGLPRCPVGLDGDVTLLRAVGEVVVAGAHVGVASDVTHLHKGSGEAGAGLVELHAVLVVLLNICAVPVLDGLEGIVVQAVLLVDVGHALAEGGVLEEEVGVGDFGDVERVVVRHVLDLHDVAAISGSLSIAVIVARVGVASSPLDYRDIISKSWIQWKSEIKKLNVG